MQVERIVVVGCGSIGRRHARNLAMRNDVALELCEPSPENLAAACQEVGDVSVHRSFDEMLRTAPQHVVIATPHALHADQTIAALNAGSNVLCEKPMSDSLAGAERMLAASQVTSRVLDIGFTLHFHPAAQHVKHLINSGEVGRVLHVHWHVGTYNTLVNSVSRYQASVFGALMLDYVHQPDLTHWWLGVAPTRVRAAGVLGENLPLIARPNVMTVASEYDAPMLATINLNYVQHPERCYCEIIGDEAWVLIDMLAGHVQLGKRSDGLVHSRSFEINRDELFRSEHNAFLRSARGERKPESPPSTAIESMYVVDAALRSLLSGGPVALARRTTVMR